jgi:RNA polymerase sigma-70 factor (ECF subfamily)
MVESFQEFPELEDAQLIKQAQKGDVNAFGNLYERYAVLTYRFMFSQTGNCQDAEDLTAEIFLKAWQALPRYQDQGFSFAPYLFRIARNTLIDSRRKRNVSIEISDFENVNLADEKTFEPSQQISEKNQQNELAAILNQLREDYRTVLILRFLNDLSTQEVSQVMGRSIGAVRVLQHRALSCLRKQIPAHRFDA